MTANSCRGLLAAIPLLLAAAAPCFADDDDNRAESLKHTAIALCTDANASWDRCRDGSFARLLQAIDAAEKALLAKAQPTTIPLLKRDQVWFRQMIETILDNSGGTEAADKIGALLQRRAALLDGIGPALGRAEIVGRWVDVLGSVAIAPAAHGAFRVGLSSDALYGLEGPEQHPACEATALVKPDADGWLSGSINADAPAPPDHQKPPRIKIRLQGETLRVVVDAEGSMACSGSDLLTGSYFPSGPAGARGRTAFAAPTFDCAQPKTASEEEICADPELAANDVRINRDWKALLPRLDPATRRLLTEDQRAWVKTQTIRYPSMLHPASAKLSYFVHRTSSGRFNLAQIQQERIALLERFDEKRHGFEGDWSAYNATLSVTPDKNGKLRVEGNKWFEEDYKGGCDYDFEGKVDGDQFIPSDRGENPDTIEFDHGTLIVNRPDDERIKRLEAGGPLPPHAPDGKCKRSPLISSTARLFPVRPASDDRK